MTYDFTSIMNRHGMDSIAVDGLGTDPGFAPDPPREGFDVIPMWVADMNFPTVPTIPQAIIERAKHPAYGYFSPTDDYYSSIIDWQSTRNGVTGLTREAIGYENGVLGGVISALTAFAAPGDGVLLHSPTYIGFTRSIENNGYRIVHSPLTLDERGVRAYECEIVRLTDSASSERGFVVRVTDPELLARTGGIVQGMSGSPILQSGKLAGAVTHVFVSDPTQGYGIFIENMLDAAA